MEQKNNQILELSNSLLSRYKKNAGASASAADASGNLQKGNKRFSGIMKATRKQFSNDAKKSVAEAKDPREYEQSEVNEAITVKKEKYSWGKMVTVHHGSDTSYPLHPEHQQAIAKLGDGEKTSFKDETNSSVHAEREGDTVHLTRPRTSSTKTSVAHSHFNEELEQGVAEATVATKHRIGLTVTDPNHPMVSKRGETYQKSVRVTGDDREKAINSAIAHYRRKGYKVHDHNYMGTVDQGVAEENLTELKKDTLSSYMAKARKDVDKKQKEIVGHRRNNNAIDARKTMSKTMTRFDGLDRARTQLNKEDTEQGVNEEWTKTGKTGTHIATGEKTFEWAKVDSEGRETGERHYRNAAGKVMGEEVVVEGIKSKIAGMALSALAAHGAAHGRVTFDDQGGHSGGYKPTATATATSTPSDNKPAAETPSGLSKEYLQRAADPNRFGRHMHLISPEKAAEHLKKMKEDKKQVVETKGTPKGFHFTKSGKLKRGDADQDGNGGPMLRSDPLDKQRNKIPAVSERADHTFKSFRNQIVEKHLSTAEMKKREEVAQAMEREQPGMPMGKKMAIATATAKKAV